MERWRNIQRPLHFDLFWPFCAILVHSFARCHQRRVAHHDKFDLQNAIILMHKIQFINRSVSPNDHISPKDPDFLADAWKKRVILFSPKWRIPHKWWLKACTQEGIITWLNTHRQMLILNQYNGLDKNVVELYYAGSISLCEEHKHDILSYRRSKALPSLNKISYLICHNVLPRPPIWSQIIWILWRLSKGKNPSPVLLTNHTRGFTNIHYKLVKF